MDSEGIIHFSFFFYALMKGRIATISFGCLCAVEERRNHRVYDMSGFSYDITDVVHLLQLRVRHKNSSSMDVNCPFCGETKGKMNVNLQKNVFRCNRCDASGGMLELHGRLHGVSSAEANRQIREALGKGEYRTEIRSMEGKIQGFQIRLDQVMEGRKYIWLSGVKFQNGVYFCQCQRI